VASSKLILVAVSFLVLVSFANAELAGNCEVKLACEGGEVAILHLTNQTNAHASTTSSTEYLWKVCCDGDEINGACPAGHANSDVVVSLSSVSNAHVEANNQGNYATDICLSNIVEYDCSVNTGNCVGLGYQVMSISSLTNAHAAESPFVNGVGYNNLICCKAVTVPPVPCNLLSAMISFSGEFGIGDSIAITGIFEGNCNTESNYIKINASNADGSCVIDKSLGGVNGLDWVIGIDGSLIFSEDTFSANWTVPNVPDSCIGETVSASVAQIYSFSKPDYVLIDTLNPASGSITFANDIVTEPFVCGDDIITSPNDDGEAEECEDELDHSEWTCAPQMNGDDLAGCSSSCQCLYGGHVDPDNPGNSIYYLYDDCIDTDPLGDGWGMQDYTKITKNSAGATISTEVFSQSCQIYLEEVPFFDWLNFVLVLFIISGYYFAGKRKLL
jgi:hypothetical protein